MEFRVLGPLEVSHEGESIAVGGPQRRTLLALLLSHVNEAVSADYLIDQLWGEEPPTASRKSLQAHVANLRRVLNVDGQLLRAQPPGYVLAVEPGQVDGLRFVDLHRRAVVGLHTDPEQARADLEEALALWRSAPLADVADESPTLRTEAARLAELRVTAWEHRADAELALGGHASVVPELERLIDQNPLREGLWARLMLALYRSGRQADALAAYQRVRRMLAEELGLEPSSELQRLESQILDQASELEWTPPLSRGEGASLVPDSSDPSSSVEPSTNLPASVSTFVGRGSEVARVIELVSTCRLVTLTGAGGSGKTRLALQAASEVVDRFPDGVWFVDLSGMNDPSLVVREVADALGLAERPDRAWRDVIFDFLAGRNLVLVMDNCEHLLEAVSGLTVSLLETSRGLVVLATSREPLGVAGEVTSPVPLMTVPTGGEGSLEDLLAFEASQLFLERAGAARPDVVFGEGDVAPIGRICRRLDGLPLALELAAARVRALSVLEIADHLEDSFAILVGGRRGELPRHQTLDATVAWSYDLLTPGDQRLFRRLSVFRGGFDLEAAGELMGGGVVTGVTSLVEKSLLVAQPVAGHTRYRMLETVAAFGHMKLGDEEPAAREAHLAWATKLARTAAASLEGTQQAEWVDRLETELDNVRAAMQWALDSGDLAPGMMIGSSLFNYWYMRGVQEGARWIGRFLAKDPEVSDEVMAWTLFTGGALLHQEGEHENERAAQMLESSLHLFRVIEDPHGIAYALHHLSRTHWGLVDPDDLRVELDIALDGFRQVEDHVGVATSLLFSLWWELEYGEPTRAVEMSDELRVLTETIGSPNLRAHGCELAATARWHARDYESARPLLHEALELYFRLGNQQCSAHCLESAAAWLLGNGDPRLATVLLAATDSLRSEIGVRAPRWERPIPERARIDAEANLGKSAFTAAWARGQAMNLDAALEAAIAATG